VEKKTELEIEEDNKQKNNELVKTSLLIPKERFSLLL